MVPSYTLLLILGGEVVSLLDQDERATAPGS